MERRVINRRKHLSNLELDLVVLFLERSGSGGNLPPQPTVTQYSQPRAELLLPAPPESRTAPLATSTIFNATPAPATMIAPPPPSTSTKNISHLPPVVPLTPTPLPTTAPPPQIQMVAPPPPVAATAPPPPVASAPPPPPASTKNTQRSPPFAPFNDTSLAPPKREFFSLDRATTVSSSTGFLANLSTSPAQRSTPQITTRSSSLNVDPATGDEVKKDEPAERPFRKSLTVMTKPPSLDLDPSASDPFLPSFAASFGSGQSLFGAPVTESSVRENGQRRPSDPGITSQRNDALGRRRPSDSAVLAAAASRPHTNTNITRQPLLGGLSNTSTTPTTPSLPLKSGGKKEDRPGATFLMGLGRKNAPKNDDDNDPLSLSALGASNSASAVLPSRPPDVPSATSNTAVANMTPPASPSQSLPRSLKMWSPFKPRENFEEEEQGGKWNPVRRLVKSRSSPDLTGDGKDGDISVKNDKPLPPDPVKLPLLEVRKLEIEEKLSPPPPPVPEKESQRK
ncbi:hypothetical protein BC829DRAFT_273359 [Chytridium lagenaria]|nr:hypothetical protein BC829DRAFT_273359 [Chytridium lagenaria]